MNRIHDMGGRYGYGKIPIPRNQNNDILDDEPVFKYPWHSKTLAITLAVGALGEWNLDTSRHSRECLPPKDYMNFSYYEKWLAALTNLMVEKNLITVNEIKKFVQLLKTKEYTLPLSENFELDSRTWLSKDVINGIMAGGPSIRQTDIKPKYKIGDKIKTVGCNPNKDIPEGHTRLPSYAMGKIGIISSYCGTHVFPDKNAHNYGENPLPVYTVEFRCSELWSSASENTDDIICLDLWEPYLKNLTL